MSEKQSKITPEEARIFDMLTAKQISASEADELLFALRRSTRILTWVYNPHAKLGTKWGMLISMVGAAIAIGLSRFGVIFDGVLALHYNPKLHPWFLVFLEALIAWPAFALCLTMAGKVLGSSGRCVEFLSVVGVSRVPLVLGGVLLAVFVGDFPATPELAFDFSIGKLVLLSSIMIPVLVLFIMWLWQGFALVCGRRDGKVVAAFIMTTVVAEITSMVILAWAA